MLVNDLIGTIMKEPTKLSLILIVLTIMTSCVKNDFPETIDLQKKMEICPR